MKIDLQCKTQWYYEKKKLCYYTENYGISIYEGDVGVITVRY